ncbi:M23 family peptidase [Streptomyces sp. NPDC001523]|uniref:M23 family peptidase n=1 Tax=Streptomyces sp. NPDC001523 TaxID=3154383 RepID=UPI00332D2830
MVGSTPDPVRRRTPGRGPGGAGGHGDQGHGSRPGPPRRAGGGAGVLSLTLPGGLRTTYEPVRPLVVEGEEVAAGQVVAVLTEGAHCPVPCLHWGLLAGETYLNPLRLLPRPTPRLLPDPGGP